MLSNKLSRREMLKLTGAVAGTSLLAACTVPPPGAAPAGSDEGAMMTDRKTIRWWDNYTAEHPLGSTLIEKVFSTFTEENPGWDVEFTFVTNSELVPKFITSRMAGEPPDLFANFAGRGSLYHAGYCLPLQDFVKELGQWDDMIDGFRNICTIGEDLVGYPALCGTKMYIYRKDFFDEAGLDADNFPDNWDDLLDAMVKLTQRDGDGNITRAGLRMGKTWDWEQMTVNAYQNGGGEFDQSDKITGPCTVNGPEFSEAFSWNLDLKRVHGINPLEGLTLPPGTWPTVEGLTAMEIQGPWWVPNMRLRKPENADLLGIGAPIARNAGGERVGLANANHIISVYTESDIQDAALSLLEVYSRAESQEALHNAIDADGEFPQFFLTALNSYNENLAWLQDEPLIRDTAFLEFAGSGRDVGYDHIGYREMAVNIWSPFTEMALFGLRDDQDALDTMAGKADSITNRILSTGA
ncbi:MAG: extracellular solute-binding protein [Chloroflexota bacterium]